MGQLGILVVIFLLVSAQAPIQEMPQSLVSLVDTERAFARTSVEKGTREAFLAFFAEDGINFRPHPVKTREYLLSQPAPAGAPATMLNWNPIYGDVSRAGDLGYTTGPYELTQKGESKKIVRRGFFFSVWKKQPDGAWRVVVDLGTTTPEEAARLDDPFRRAPASPGVSANCGADQAAELKELLAADRRFFDDAAQEGQGRAYAAQLADHSRLHREGFPPFAHQNAIQSYLAAHPGFLSGEPLRSDVASSCDLGYTYGRYELQLEKGGKTSSKGYYQRVWRRNSEKQWKIVADVATIY